MSYHYSSTLLRTLVGMRQQNNNIADMKLTIGVIQPGLDTTTQQTGRTLTIGLRQQHNRQEDTYHWHQTTTQHAGHLPLASDNNTTCRTLTIGIRQQHNMQDTYHWHQTTTQHAGHLPLASDNNTTCRTLTIGKSKQHNKQDIYHWQE